MINANELRFRNLIDLNGLVISVFDINHRWVKEQCLINGKTADKYEPIPLSPDILEKAGFEYRYLSPKQHYFENAMVSINTYKNKDAFYYESQLCDVEIKFVHQLQNLFYCLTGEELTINL